MHPYISTRARSPETATTATERRVAEQGIAGQWGQLARCTGPGSRTVVHLTESVNLECESQTCGEPN